MAKEITSSEDIQFLVNEFYEKVIEDELLGPIFENVVKGNWDKHLEKMYGFWETIVFNVKKYTGSPFQKHIPLPIEAKHFERWLALFHTTINQHFEGKKAEEIKKRSTQMGLMFEYKLKHIKGGE
ncbi:group III truncated hemoglobin [Vicingaceae bacterium]|nr:group III truncated hemoglobin [Vicingaceae bacterium]MDB4061986.1 group III truncated hemoglobin [Vicingaceae bacterium]MDC1452099.1 group III truncated hemoglobin [Vicingaceae bacterium]